jgi:hypothetical protein
MVSMRNWILGAAVVAGTLGLAAAPAQAAEFRAYARGPVAHVVVRPGVGYAWGGGYRAPGYWAPGGWNYDGVRGPAVRFGGGRFYGRDFYRGHERFRR